MGTSLPNEKNFSPAATLGSIRNRFRQASATDLSDHELLALVVGHGCSHQAPLALAERLLAATEGLAQLARKDPLELSRLEGLGPARACLLHAAFELGRRAAATAPVAGERVRSAAEVAEWFRCRLQDCERESVHALLLDGRHRLIREIKIGEGSWTGCQVDPKVVFAACLRYGACALILVHNHPSGDPVPSREDLELTDRLVRAGRLLEVRLVDHIVVSRGGYTSLAEGGFI